VHTQKGNDTNSLRNWCSLCGVDSGGSGYTLVSAHVNVLMSADVQYKVWICLTLCLPRRLNSLRLLSRF
jgi:hypothetical protein